MSPDTTEERPQPTDAERAIDRLRSTSRAFYLLAAVHLFGVAQSAQALARGGPIPRWVPLLFVLAYGAALVFSVVVARSLIRRERWAVRGGTILALVNLAAVALLHIVGFVAVVGAFVAFIALVSLHVANGLGAFED